MSEAEQQQPLDYIPTPQEDIDDEALELRAANLTYRQIGDMMCVNASTAYRRVRRAIQRRIVDLEESPRMSRHIELVKLERLERIILREAHEGDLAAVRLVLKMMDMRRKYIGNDAAMLPLTDPKGVPRPLEVAIGDREEIELVDKIFRLVMNESLRRFREFRQSFDDLDELKKELDAIYAITRREVMSDETWEELIGRLNRRGKSSNTPQQNATKRNAGQQYTRPEHPKEDDPPTTPRCSPYCT